jgi:AcrR family transcriptional regulator
MTVHAPDPPQAPAGGARERILAAAGRRYYAEGIRAASADRLLAEAGVSKVTFYRHFPTKDDLVVAYLEATAAAERAAVLAERAAHPGDPGAVLRWYAGVVGDLACGPGFRGCPFINAAAEFPDPDSLVHKAVTEHRSWFRATVVELLTQAGLPNPEKATRTMLLLRDGAMVGGYLENAADTRASLVEAVDTVLVAKTG